MDYQKTLNDRSDYVGGIDNEAIFFEDLHVATSVGSLDADGGRSSSLNGVESATFVCSAKAETPVTSPTSIPLQEPTLPPIPTISARVSVTSTAHIGIHATNSNSNNLTHSHLPESPPDSSSEPPFSPSQDVHGLTLTSRDLYNGPGIENNVASAIHELHTLPTQQQHHSHHPSQQYATSPPEHQQSHTNNYSHLLQSSHENANGLVRVKHESSLLVNPSALQTIFNNRSVDTHAEIPTSHSFYSNNTHLNYDSLANKMYAPTITSSSSSYQLDLGNVDLNSSISTSSACMLNTVTDLPHVQAVGTSHASIPSTPQLSRTSTPSTPNHQSLSRKRKMTTDIDCSEYTSIKPDPGLVMSPSRSALCVTPLKSANESKVSPTSPLNIQLSSQNSTSASDLCSTAPHSTASLSPALSISNTNGEICVDTSKNSENGIDTLSPCIKFTAFQPQSWHKLCDQNLQELSVVYYRVDADKGFNFSISDDAFVCQKKNHFQITCHARLQGEAKFVKTPSGLEKIKSFHLHFYGVKLEAPNQTIRVEQSQSDRSKKPFYPVPIDLQSHIVSKVTVGRLHFSETTNNNMRKKGRPNPEQRYFQLVVALHVHTASGDFPIVSQGSDKIIVRASNPGQFESDVDLCWQRGLTQDSIYHAGRVGINTDRPDESLVVHGNLKISGHIVQPSDSRAKQEIGELDTSVQLRNLQKIRIVRYRLEPEFALHSGLKCKNGSGDIVDTGVIAQEVREVIPDAVQEAGSIVLPNGNVIENFLLVNKDRILMENIGAVKELCKVTGTLESRIENLERVNHRLQRAKDTELQFMRNKIIANKQNHEICSNRTLQITIFLLVIVMAACLAAVSTLYFVEHSRKQHVFKHLESIHVLSNGHVYRPDILSLAEQERIYLNNRSNKTHNFLYQSASSTVAMSSNYTKYRGEIISGGMETIEDIVPTLQSRNDELTAIMEKPSVENELKQFNPEPLRSITSHMVRTNKTINSKTKIKPQVGRNTVFRAIYNRPNEGVSLQATDASDTSSERIAGGNELLQPDLDNNSIDTDHKPVTSKTRLPQIKDNSRHSDIQKLNTETLVSGLRKSQQDNAPPQIHHVHRSNAVIDESGLYKTSSPLNLLVSTTISTTTSLGTVTSRISQKVNTEAPHANYSLDIQPISNKSRHILDRTTDNAEDLQSLTNNNESAYNTISDPLDFIFYNIRAPSLSSTTQHKHHQAQNTDAGDWLISRHFYTDTFGEPEHCNNKIERADISNCQSVCFEENNQLLAPNHLSLGLKPSETKRSKTLITQEAAIGSEKSNERTDDDDDETERVLQENDDELQASYGGSLHLNLNSSRLLVAGKSSHSTQALTKQLSAEQRSAEIVENLDTILEHGFSNDNEPKATKQERHDFPNQKQIQQTKLLIEPNRPPSSADCWKVHSCILAERVNKTFSVDEYCPKLGKSMNVTFTVPLSRYFKEQSIELHLTSTSPLHWVLCNNHELTKTNGKHLPTTQQTLQRLRNTSLLLLNIPSRGYFVKDLNLRATSDTEKATICEEKTYETNPILQYNFRILRNCD
uniref:Myelin regulatory factor n=1 Tax=Glossina brevipalpis TaxID=37001 RepID=A0A1A9X4A1_9MUSC